ncbi:hypothetical protein MHU86_1167 [Fragilaria crotonensis]|nr:hypothetical protein MHU86_1167 [Fragilaria crotonensis]
MMLSDRYTDDDGNEPHVTTKTTTTGLSLDEKRKRRRRRKEKKKKNKKSGITESKNRRASMESHQDSNFTKTTATESSAFFNSSAGDDGMDVDHAIWPLDQEHQWDATTKGSDVASIGGFSHNERLWAGLKTDQSVVSATGESVDPRKVFTKIDRQERIIINSQSKRQRGKSRDGTSRSNRENRQDSRRRESQSSGFTETLSPNVMLGDMENEPDPLVQYLVSLGFDHGDARLVSESFLVEQDTGASVKKGFASKPSDDGSSNAASRKMQHLHSPVTSSPARIMPCHASVIPGCCRMIGRDPSATPEAIPVVEDYSNKWPIIYADSGPLSMMHALKDRNLRLCLLLGILIVVAAVTTTAVVLSTRGSGDANSSAETLESTMSPSSSPTFINDEILIAASRISGWEALNKEDSPQMKAVGWMSTFDETDFDEFGSAFIQRYCLVVFYFSTGGPNWLNQHSWLDPKLHVCSWGEGTSCFPDGSNQLIFIGLDETRNGVSGTLPVELGFLSETVFLRLSKNDIGGSIPSEIGKLKRLSTLDLSSNMITGSIPETIGDAAELVQLDLSYNRINGTIPSSFYDLVRLQLFGLASNEITGPIEADVGKLQEIVSFDVRNNSLTGTLTAGFDELTALDFLWLDYNKFTGQIPAVSAVMASRLEITMSHNNLAGTIPIVSMMRRYLQDAGGSNPFRVQKIDLSYNRLSGTIDTVTGYLPTLRYADFSGNNFVGQFPGDYGWTGIEFLGIANNNFNGTISTWWPQSLSHLDVANNSLTGSIPSELCNFPGLKLLGLGGNANLTATLPTCLFQLPVLQNLNLASINLEGTIPAEIGMLTLLEYLDLSGNSLTGTIPSQIGFCSNLAAIDLSSNQLGAGFPVIWVSSIFSSRSMSEIMIWLGLCRRSLGIAEH